MKRFLITLACFTLLIAPVAYAAEQEIEVLDVVRGFYSWVLVNGKDTLVLEPKIKDVPGSTKFYLDTSTLDAFTARFMSSGYFSPDFPAAVARYYNKYKADFAAMSQKDFNEAANGGRGPMMETEDMDIFFCAQEYEYRKQFIQDLKIKSASFSSSKAKVIIVSPYKWETEFHLVKVNNRWLISGYCVFH
jgi:hypothetical protein